ncbi:unnamed protein product [Cyclocybe aegerita]|uniref:Uncharacterized protein n=1 Tax=Cyclocybe aegerita TaxID=1973307 RepID=A0A8S0X4C9_CYCAE|nr:unnamed protein product [Cyclocybe aegerita]
MPQGTATSSLNRNGNRPIITGKDIPDDIWYLIASYLADGRRAEDLRRFMSIHRCFFNFVLDLKYGEVRWVRIDKAFMTILKRLQSSVISSHVRRLYVRAWFVEYLLKREADSKLTNHGYMGLASFLVPSLKKPTGVRSGNKDVPASRVVDSNLSAKKILPLLVTAMKGMTGVIEFHFEWRDLPLNKDTKMFLTTTRTTFSSSLRKLALQAQLSKFRELLAIADYENLDELEFHFDYTPSRSPGDGSTAIDDTDARELRDTILPFIARRRSALRSLSITASSTLDLSDFLRNLPFMPGLRRFESNISFCPSTLSDPSSFVQILDRHSTSLLHVSLKPGTPLRKRYWERVHEQLLLSRQALCDLESLEIPFLSPYDKTRLLVGRSCDTITKLWLTDCALELKGVEDVLNMFAHRPYALQDLHLGVRVLNLPLVHLLALRLPNLYSLTLVYATCGDVGFFTPADIEPAVHVVLFDWKLNEINLCQGKYQPPTLDTEPLMTVGLSEECHIMKLISEQVPTIRTWKGFPKDRLTRFLSPYGH